MIVLCFFFNDTATTEIYTLSLHDALPIYALPHRLARRHRLPGGRRHRAARPDREAPADAGQPAPPGLPLRLASVAEDRKSTRLNSSHANISYAVFCLKKKKVIQTR